MDISSIEEGDSISDSEDNLQFPPTPKKVSPSKNRDITKNLFLRENKKLDFNDIFKVVDTKLHDCENPSHSAKEHKEFQDQPTDASPIIYQDTDKNKMKFFNSLTPRTLKYSVNGDVSIGYSD